MRLGVLEQSGTPLDLPNGEAAKLIADIRSDEADLTETARLLRGWAA
ncbi:hypothetical protein ACFWFF_11170 [Streptomyces sp. NPDC060223]